MIEQTPSIPMPDWIIPREGWTYAGWISRNPQVSTLDELIADMLESDHGELREVDYYDQGIACWWKEPTP